MNIYECNHDRVLPSVLNKNKNKKVVELLVSRQTDGAHDNAIKK